MRFVLSTLFLTLLIGTTTLVVPEAARRIRRAYIQSQVVRLEMLDGSGGATGFHVRLPNGSVKLISAAHYCERAPKSLAYSPLTKKPQIVKVLRMDKEQDLCELSPLPGAMGLLLGGNGKLGDRVRLAGHPLGYEFTMTRGDLVQEYSAELVAYPILSEDDAERCEKTRNHRIEPQLFFEICVETRRVFLTTAIALPGNSGGPALDIFGRVIGVVVVSGEPVYWGSIASGDSLKAFLGVK